MTLPKSFGPLGFLPPDIARRKGQKFRGLMVGTQGEANTGKTEFALSAPGPGVCICLDRGFDSVFDNPSPPPTRREDFGFVVCKAPKEGQHTDGKKGMEKYQEYWQTFYTAYKNALANEEVRTVIVDGDSYSWEMQKLAEWGHLTTFPQVNFRGVNSARMVMYDRAWDSGKIVICTNMLKDEWEDIRDAEGNIVLNKETGKPEQRRTGRRERQGFPNYSYRFQIQLEHLYNEARGIWGLKILECKANSQFKGQELWGDDCNFQTLTELVYPHVDPSEWGY